MSDFGLSFWAILKRIQSPIVYPDGRCSFFVFFEVHSTPPDMQLSVAPKSVLDAYRTPIVQQTAFWSRVKQSWVSTRGLLSSASATATSTRESAATRARRPIWSCSSSSSGATATSPTSPTDPRLNRAKKTRAAFLRNSPSICAPTSIPDAWRSATTSTVCRVGARPKTSTSRDAGGNCPKKAFQEINLNFGTAEHNLRKSNMNVLPADTIVLDLTRSEERILASMKPKTRYNIRLSQKKAIEVRAGLAHSTSGTRPTSKRLAATGCTSTTSGTSARFFPRSSQTK